MIALQPGDQLDHEWVSSRATIALITTMMVTWLTTASGVQDITSAVALREVKYSTELPI